MVITFKKRRQGAFYYLPLYKAETSTLTMSRKVEYYQLHKPTLNPPVKIRIGS